MRTEQSKPQAHPLQKYVGCLMRISGALIALFMVSMTAVSVFLVIDSSLLVGETVGLITMLVVMFACFFFAYLSLQIRRSPIMITYMGKTRPLDAQTPIYYFLLACGFVQTVFWVVQPEKGNHEPRSALIFISAGLIAFFRYQIQKNEQYKKAQAQIDPSAAVVADDALDS